jgi:hypothetical protein
MISNERNFMVRTKNVEAFCNICGAIKKFEITGYFPEKENETKRWAKCKFCKQTQVIDLGDIVLPNKPDFNEIETRESKNYSPTETYSIGDVIYHKTWDDYGVVTNKLSISDGQSSLIVEFKKLGNKKLVESIKTQPGSEVI